MRFYCRVHFFPCTFYLLLGARLALPRHSTGSTGRLQCLLPVVQILYGPWSTAGGRYSVSLWNSSVCIIYWDWAWSRDTSEPKLNDAPERNQFFSACISRQCQIAPVSLLRPCSLCVFFHLLHFYVCFTIYFLIENLNSSNGKYCRMPAMPYVFWGHCQTDIIVLLHERRMKKKKRNAASKRTRSGESA